MTIVAQAITVARDVRAALLHDDATPRNLAGECGLASMLMAAALDKPHALRTGFFMKREAYLGKGGAYLGKDRRYPYRHAWCRVGATIVDATATQFDRRCWAVHVVRHDEDDRYVETASGADAIDDIMTSWRGRELPAYAKIARALRRRLPR